LWLWQTLECLRGAIGEENIMQKFLAAVFAAISFAAGATPVTIEWGLSDVSPFNPTPPPERIGGAGIMVVDNQTDGFDKILSLSGEVNGHPITGLTSSPFADANVFDEDGVGSFVTSRGIRFEVEDLIADVSAIVMMTKDGYIKRMSPDTFTQQHRGGKGVIGLTTKEQDAIERVITSTTHEDMMFFTSRGRVFRLKAYEIPEASRTAKGQAMVNFLELGPGESVIFSTGVSPVGVSFRETTCTGYLAQTQEFTPQLSNSCPRPTDLLPRTVENVTRYGADCVDFVEHLPQCSFPTILPGDLTSACRAYLTNTFSYTGCTRAYSASGIASMGTWRAYAALGDELWLNTHDAIVLYDGQGRTVSTISY
jgi:hypothetical protein